MLNIKIEEALKYFEVKKRGEEDIVVLKEGYPEELLESVHKAHGNRLPVDWVYEKYFSILSSMADYVMTEDKLDEYRGEIVDGLVDIYTYNLTKWLSGNIYNVYYLTEVLEEYGNIKDGFRLLAMAQYKAIDEIYSEVVDYLIK